jgi:prolyl oligopeptidase
MWRAVLGCLVLAVTSCTTQPSSHNVPANDIKYPSSPIDPVVDNYHGTDVADPYRWLEALGSADVTEWVKLQNDVAEQWLKTNDLQHQLRPLVDAALRYPAWGRPRRAGSVYFYSYADGEKNQPVVYVTRDLNAQGDVLLDPNTFSADGTMALTGYQISRDGRYLAYGVSDGGSDWRTWRVLDVQAGKPLDDVLTGIKFSEAVFSADGKYLYYSRYPVDADGEPNDQAQVEMFRHRLGTLQTDDEVVFRIDDHPTRNPYGAVSDDGAYLVIGIFDGFESNGIYYLPLQEGLTVPGQEPIRLLDKWDARYEFLGNDGDVFLFLTDQGAARGRVIAIDTANPGPAVWQELVAESADTLESASYLGGRLVLSYIRDAHAYIVVVNRQGAVESVPELPGLGSVVGFHGPSTDTETFFTYEDFATRSTVYRYDVSTNEVQVFRARPAAVSSIVTEQVFIASKDGTQVPAFLVRRADVRPNGKLPTLLYGYGGFNQVISPSYGAMAQTWVELGGLFVSTNLRGGGEYGADWHEAGTKARKQNVYDDFIAVAEWLVETGYTQPANLGITGRSNGGLLVAAALTQRPELFGAALPAVGVLDMLRYHTASANARAWSSDYGLSENAEEFEALLAYSPYHQLKVDTCYPPTLVTTADRDDRVVPWHSYKFTARMQAVQSCPSPVMILVETRAGHGAGKPISMVVDDYTAQLSFAAAHLGLVVPH